MRGASRAIFQLAALNVWTLLVTPYVVNEVVRNLAKLPDPASVEWGRLRQQLLVMDDVLTIEFPTVFPVSKDRPVLFSAYAWADVLLTLDRRDFSAVLRGSFYGLRVSRPGQFLEDERAGGRLRILQTGQ